MSTTLTTLEQLILKYPTAADWNWRTLSTNPNVSFQFILDHLDLPWVWNGFYGVGSNPSVSLNDIDTHPELPWDIGCISHNPNLDDEHLQRWFDAGMEGQIKWCGVSDNSKMTPEFIERHIDRHVFAHDYDYGGFWFNYSGSPLITMDFVQRHPDNGWDWVRLTANPAFTISFILNNFTNYPWSLRGLFLRNDLTIDIVKSIDHIPWNMDYILRRIPITGDVIREYWNMENGRYRTHILENPSFRYSILDALENRRHRRLSRMEWGNFTAHPSVTMEFIEAHPEFAWNLHNVGSNPNITVDFVDRHFDKINFSDLSSNSFHFNYNQRHKASLTIRQWCFDKIIIPNRQRRAIRITSLILGKVSGGRLMGSRDCRKIATFMTG